MDEFINPQWPSLSGTLASTLAVVLLPVGFGALTIFLVAASFSTIAHLRDPVIQHLLVQARIEAD